LIIKEITQPCQTLKDNVTVGSNKYEGWNFNSGNYLFTTDTK